MSLKTRIFPALILGLALSLAVSFSGPVGGQDPKKPLTAEAMLSFKSIGTVALSPSGNKVAFDVTSVDWGRNTFSSDVWLADVASGDCFAVTKGPDP